MTIARRTILAGGAALAAASAARAQAPYPDRPIRLVVPFPPGGVTDVVARLLAQKLAADLGQPVIVENKAGAGGVIGSEFVAKAPADGHTLLFTTPNHTINAAFRAAMPYDTEKDLQPVSIAGQVQLKLDTYATAGQFVADRKLNALAITSLARSKLLPDVPTVAENGLPGFEGYLWMGIVAPAGTPKAVIDRLAAASNRAVQSQDLRERFDKEGIDPVGNTPGEFRALVAREIAQWRELAKATKIAVD